MIQHTNECPRCHVLRYAGPSSARPYTGLCAACVQQDREPQGEAVRLFTPAPPVMPGQLGFGSVSDAYPLSPARGIVRGILLCLPFWILFAVAVIVCT